MPDKIPPIITADELLDIAFKRSQKIQIPDRDRRYRIKKTIIARCESFVTIITSRLEGIVKTFPSLNQLSPFYQELIEIKIDSNRLKQALGAVHWAFKTSSTIYSKQKKSLSKSRNEEFLKQKKRKFMAE